MSVEKISPSSAENQSAKSYTQDYSKAVDYHFSKEAKVEQAELAVLNSLRNAVSFAQLAEDHRSLFDPVGFEHCAEQFLANARKASEALRTLKSLKKEASKG
jgi:hypothetical protein